MIFLDKTTEDDFFSSLESNMKKTASFEKNLSKSRLESVASHLSEAAFFLKNAGLNKEAQMVLTLQEVCLDPATEDLDSESMLKNLEEKGWVFNAEDEHCADTCEADDCSMCSEGAEPQLSQSELKKLRKLLK